METSIQKTIKPTPLTYLFFLIVQLSYNLSKAIRTELINIFTPDAQVQNKK